MRPCSLLSLATAVPPNVIEQQEAKAIGRRVFARKNLCDKLAPVFDNAAIARRHFVAPHKWYEEPHGWAELRHVLFKMNVELDWFEKYAMNRSYTWEKAPAN